MTSMNLLRDQHEAVMAMAHRLLELIDDYQPGAPGHAMLMQLNRLYGILRVHLAQEDVAFYPRLLASTNPAIAGTARAFAGEMGELAIDLECFARHWSTSASIVAGFAEFREAAQELVMRLAVRIERETQDLFPLAEDGVAAQRDAA